MTRRLGNDEARPTGRVHVEVAPPTRDSSSLGDLSAVRLAVVVLASL